MTEDLLYEVKDRVAHMTIHREASRNAISQEMITAFLDYLDRADQDEAVAAVCITGAGDKVFCSGADLGIAFHNVAHHISLAEVIHHRPAALGFGLEDAVTDPLAPRRSRPGFEVIADDGEIAQVIAAIHRAMDPVEDNIVREREVAIPQLARLRRLQHELVQYRGIQSKSEGEEPFRRLVVYPA